MTNYNNIPENLVILRDCLCKGVEVSRYSHQEWMEICNALDYVAMKLGYVQSFESKKGYEKIKKMPKNQRGNNA